ncbi:MAG: hypothetical protein RML12_04010 [Xanthomonadales bacterium]|nr:hypothetical protein [Xanthomonadales bacterium]
MIPASLTSLLLLPLALAGGRTPPAGADAYGYQLLEDPHPLCPVQWIDLSAAPPLVFTPAGSHPAGDDGGAQVTLSQPFRFYDLLHSALTVSSNGYLAFAPAGFPADDGGHWRADCPLPAIPDNAAAAFGRIYALGGDLEAGSGVARAQFFASCPRPPSYGSDTCTVIEWSGWSRRGVGPALNAQVVLYHGRREIVVQYGTLTPAAAAGLTVGIQSQGADSALTVGCGSGFAPASGRAHCFFHPQFPAGLPPPPNPDLIFADGFEAWP